MLARYANRVPLQFQPGACLITQTVMGMNWRAYGLNQVRGQLPRGAVTLIVHLASVWVPFWHELIFANLLRTLYNIMSKLFPDT